MQRALGLRPGWWTVLPTLLELTTVTTMRMLEQDAFLYSVSVFIHVHVHVHACMYHVTSLVPMQALRSSGSLGVRLPHNHEIWQVIIKFGGLIGSLPS